VAGVFPGRDRDRRQESVDNANQPWTGTRRAPVLTGWPARPGNPTRLGRGPGWGLDQRLRGSVALLTCCPHHSDRGYPLRLAGHLPAHLLCARIRPSAGRLRTRDVPWASGL